MKMFNLVSNSPFIMPLSKSQKIEIFRNKKKLKSLLWEDKYFQRFYLQRMLSRSLCVNYSYLFVQMTQDFKEVFA